MSPGSRGASAGRSSGRRPTARAPRSTPASFAISDSSSFVPASSVRPNWASSRAITPRISSRRVIDVRVRLAHDVDDHRGRLGHERLAPAEQAAVADRAPEELAQDVAAALVRGQHVVGDQERDRARVVGDDLVAEALALEGVRVVAQELAHPGVDRREQVGVVVGRDLLEDAGQALQAEAGIDARERQRHPPVGLLVELHEHEVPDLEPARALSRCDRGCSAAPRTGARRDRNGSRCTARTDRSRPSARSCCRRRCRRRPRRAIRSGGRPISSRQTWRATSSSLYVVAASRSPGIPRSRVRKSQAKRIASRLK